MSWIDDLIKPEPEVLADFVLTGTGVYGPKTPGKSDIDIVLPYPAVCHLATTLHERSMPFHVPEEGEECLKKGSIVFTLGPLRFHVVPADSYTELNWWQTQTDRMKKFAPIEDRAERLRVFQGGEP